VIRRAAVMVVEERDVMKQTIWIVVALVVAVGASLGLRGQVRPAGTLGRYALVSGTYLFQGAPETEEMCAWRQFFG
jgi:hypothetical protein